MATLLMLLPDNDFDPTESGVPWRTMRDHGHRVVFATPSGRTARADPKMVTGEGLGMLSPLLKADANGRSAYLEMEQSDAGFRRPISYGEISAGRLGVGFTVRDGEYLSARWPGDAHRFAAEFAAMIG
jgi:protease I